MAIRCQKPIGNYSRTIFVKLRELRRDVVLNGASNRSNACRVVALKATEMGRKAGIPYGLYRCHGFISAHLAAQTGFSEEDLEILFRGLCGRASVDEPFQPSMMDSDVSSSRRLTPQKLVVFKHDSMLGNAPAHKLFGASCGPKGRSDQVVYGLQGHR